MVMSLFFNGLDSDIEFWRDWTLQLQKGGYHALDANYPPLILHWLRLFAWLNDYLGVSSLSDGWIKAWMQLPVFLCHLYLLERVGKELSRQGLDPLRSATFWVTAFNPALLLNGAVWGQVDLLPFIPLYFCFLFSIDKKRAHWSWPCLAIALLCKFQAILFVPLLCGLSIRFPKRHALGILIAIIVFVIGFLPFIISGDAKQAFNRAYLENLEKYPYSSMNATNLWYLLSCGSHRQNSLSLLTGEWASLPIASWVTSTKIGFGSFGLLSALIALVAMQKKQLEEVFGLAVLSVVSFFAVSSGMHDRYMFLAVPFAVLWGCKARQYLFWYPVLTALVYINMNLVVPLAGRGAWNFISLCVVLALIIMVLQVGFNVSFARFKWVLGIAECSPLSPYVLLIFMWVAFMANEYQLGINHSQAVVTGRCNP